MKNDFKLSNILTKAMMDPFKVDNSISLKGQAISQRENDPDLFIKRITPQIIEVYKNDLGYLTPEDWDKSFYILGGGHSRRMSNTILSRMSWNQFLDKFNIVVNNIN